MKLLRETIRRLILENQRHYENIAAAMMRAGLSRTVIMGDAIDDMFNYITLAETLGYVSDVTHIKQPPTFEGTLYTWEFTATQPLFDELKRVEQKIDRTFGYSLGNDHFARRLDPQTLRVTIKLSNPKELNET